MPAIRFSWNCRYKRISFIFYRPFVSHSRGAQIAEPQIAVSVLCVLCGSSEAGGIQNIGSSLGLASYEYITGILTPSFQDSDPCDECNLKTTGYTTEPLSGFPVPLISFITS